MESHSGNERRDGTGATSATLARLHSNPRVLPWFSPIGQQQAEEHKSCVGSFLLLFSKRIKEEREVTRTLATTLKTSAQHDQHALYDNDHGTYS